MRVLIVKLSSLGDVVHAMPVVHDILAARPGARIDWVVDPGFAPLVQRVDGIGDVVACALRRWARAWWTRATRAEWRGFREQLRRQRYDAVLDLQGLTKSAVIARLAQGVSYGLANRTDGASHEPPARWLVDHPITIEPHVHAVDRSRQLAAKALGYRIDGPPVFGLRAAPVQGAGGDHLMRGAHGAVGIVPADSLPAAAQVPPLLVFVHGSSRVDKLWSEDAWIELGRRAVAEGWRIALPHADTAELARAERLRNAIDGGVGRAPGSAFDSPPRSPHSPHSPPGSALGGQAPRAVEGAVEIWPAMPLDALVDRLGAVQGVIGVDSGLSHIAVALDLPHVQIYNFPTAWRTGPQPEHGHRHQVSVEARPTPTLDDVWAAWQDVQQARPARHLRPARAAQPVRHPRPERHPRGSSD